jgi:hypothetical protein
VDHEWRAFEAHVEVLRKAVAGIADRARRDTLTLALDKLRIRMIDAETKALVAQREFESAKQQIELLQARLEAMEQRLVKPSTPA